MESKMGERERNGDDGLFLCGVKLNGVVSSPSSSLGTTSRLVGQDTFFPRWSERLRERNLYKEVSERSKQEDLKFCFQIRLGRDQISFLEENVRTKNIN